jgi:DNA-binding transcriptional LysR family regulator
MIAAAEERNFTAAAKRLYIAQPALSQSIQQLEAELGVKLFVRSSRMVMLTPAGHAFYREAVGTLDQLRQAVREAQHADLGETHRLSLGFTTTSIMGELSQKLRNFHKQNPDIHLVLTELPVDQIVDQVLEGKLDIGCTDSNIVLSIRLESMSLKPVPMVVVLSKTHPLAKYSSLRLEMLSKEKFIFPTRHQCQTLYDTFIRACREAGFEPNCSCYAESVPAGLGLVAADIGITLQHDLPLSYPGVVRRRITSPRTHLYMQLIWRRDQTSQTVTTFLQTP